MKSNTKLAACGLTLGVLMASVANAAELPPFESGSGPLLGNHEFGLTLVPADDQGGGGGEAEEGEAKGELSKEELAKLAQNPIGNIISIPFQNNFNFGVGPNNV